MKYNKYPVMFWGFIKVILFLMCQPVFSSENPHGFLDSVTISHGKVLASGWAVSSKPNNKVELIEIYLGDKLALKSTVESAERRDVVNSTGRLDWLNVGWLSSGPLSTSIQSGNYPLRAVVKFASGERFDLSIPVDMQSIFVASSHNSQANRIIDIALLTILFALVFFCLAYSRKIASYLSSSFSVLLNDWGIVAIALAIAFVCLVSLGITGSSLRIGLQGSEDTTVVDGDMASLLGTPKQIRADEWMVLTPQAIGQLNHNPPFPIHNLNLGPDGHNMLVLGMTGVPVNHLSALARPATWGFFFLDLRRALAWYWWFPIFGCLFAVWGMMYLLLKGQWEISLGLATLFTSSAYVVAWSAWPAYTVFFPATAFSIIMLVLSSNSVIRLSFLSVALGLSLAGFVLILYPPWQVSVGYLFLAVSAGVVARDNLYRAVSWRRAVALFFGIAIAGLICAAWWYDAREAINDIRATIYPGQRTNLTGGEWHVWELMRGFINIYTLYVDGGGLTNQSEASSFPFFLPLILVASLISLLRNRVPSWIEINVYLFCFASLLFQFIGLPPAIAQISQLGRVPVYRFDLAFGLALIILYGLILSSLLPGAKLCKEDGIGAKVLAAIWAIVVFSAMLKIPQPIRSGITTSVMLAISFLSGAIGFWLLTGRVNFFLTSSLLWSAAVSLPFNPIEVAPNRVDVATSLKRWESGQRSRILVVGSMSHQMMLLASGEPIANGVFLYPQKSLYQSLDPIGSSSTVTNRFQHLIYTPGEVPDANGYRLELVPPGLVVQVVFDPKIFDFRLSLAQRVLAPLRLEGELASNAHLKYIDRMGSWLLYEVI